MVGPQREDVPRIRLALTWYKVSAAVTGVFLLLLVVMMVTRYGFGCDLALGTEGFGCLPAQIIEAEAGINISTIILVVHGWLYVVYLVMDFWLWRLVRYSFLTFCLIALGGVIPFLSFAFEWWVPKRIEAAIAHLATGPSTGTDRPEEIVHG